MILARKGILAQDPKEPIIEKTKKLDNVKVKNWRSSKDTVKRGSQIRDICNIYDLHKAHGKNIQRIPQISKRNRKMVIGFTKDDSHIYVQQTCEESALILTFQGNVN